MNFELATPRYRLRAEGVAQRIRPRAWTGHEVGAAVSSALARSQFVNSSRSANRVRSAYHPQTHPIVVGAIPFDTRQPACLYIPENVNFTPVPNGDHTPSAEGFRAFADEGAGTLHITHDDPEQYRGAVVRALESLRGGRLDKVVLARHRIVTSEKAFVPEVVFERLARRNPHAHTYRFDLGECSALNEPDVARSHGGSPSGTLIGASPELVLATHEGMLESFPLAGSAARGTDEQTDQAAARELRSSHKNLAEHRYVTTAIRGVFEEFAADIVCPEAPELVKTPVIWHLGTRITGRIRTGVSPMEILYALHPTPAVCGVPRERAFELIDRLENFHRGMYAGVVGWMDARGNSEWVMALRGGVFGGELGENQALLAAGAGVVAESHPEHEVRETEVKLRTIMAALGELRE